MAFIVTASVGASRGCPTSKQKCSSRPAALTIGIPSVAAAIISAALLSPMPLWALDGVLVFDHDQSLSGANFANRQDLKGAIFSKSNCKNATFAASNLTNAQLDDANVRSKLFAYFVVAVRQSLISEIGLRSNMLTCFLLARLCFYQCSYTVSRGQL